MEATHHLWYHNDSQVVTESDFLTFLSLQEFVLKVKNPDKPVAPGLEVPACVEYCTSEKGEHNDRLVLTIDDEVIEVPLNAYV